MNNNDNNQKESYVFIKFNTKFETQFIEFFSGISLAKTTNEWLVKLFKIEWNEIELELWIEWTQKLENKTYPKAL